MMHILLRTGLGLLALLSVVLLALSALPHIETNRWFVRLADFPRLQLLIAILITVVAVILAFRRWPLLAAALGVALVVAAITHAVTLWPFRPGGDHFVDTCDSDRTLSVLVVNVLQKNRRADAVLALVERERPDIVLALETNAWWADALAPLAQQLPHRVQEINEKRYGLMLFSRLPLISPRIRYFAAQDVPAVTAGVKLPNGETVHFIGLHPRPPRPSQSTTGRDAQIYEAAFLMRESERPTVVAGDLNATPWETTVERMRRIGRLIDPRHGYGYLATYSARSWWRSWPLDHVLYQPGFATISLARLEDVGSDHYPYLARLCHGTADEAPPPLHSGDLEEARDAMSRAQQEPQRFAPVRGR